MVELVGLGSLTLGRSKGFEGIHVEPLNFTKSSTLNVGLMPSRREDLTHMHLTQPY